MNKIKIFGLISAIIMVFGACEFVEEQMPESRSDYDGGDIVRE